MIWGGAKDKSKDRQGFGLDCPHRKPSSMTTRRRPLTQALQDFFGAVIWLRLERGGAGTRTYLEVGEAESGLGLRSFLRQTRAEVRAGAAQIPDCRTKSPGLTIAPGLVTRHLSSPTTDRGVGAGLAESLSG